MKITEAFRGYVDSMKKSIEPRVTKISEFALTILKFIFAPVTFLYDRAKSFYDKKRNSTKNAENTSPITASPSFFEKFVYKTLLSFYTLKNSLIYPKKRIL